MAKLGMRHLIGYDNNPLTSFEYQVGDAKRPQEEWKDVMTKSVLSL